MLMLGELIPDTSHHELMTFGPSLHPAMVSRMRTTSSSRESHLGTIEEAPGMWHTALHAEA